MTGALGFLRGSFDIGWMLMSTIALGIFTDRINALARQAVLRLLPVPRSLTQLQIIFQTVVPFMQLLTMGIMLHNIDFHGDPVPMAIVGLVKRWLRVENDITCAFEYEVTVNDPVATFFSNTNYYTYHRHQFLTAKDAWASSVFSKSLIYSCERWVGYGYACRGRC